MVTPTQIILTYKDIFDDFENVRCEDLIAEIDTSILVLFINCYDNIGIENQIAFFKKCNTDNNSTRKLDVFLQLHSSNGNFVTIINNVSKSLLYKKIFTYKTITKPAVEKYNLPLLPIDKQLKVIKAILLCNQEIIDKQLYNDLTLLEYLVTSQLPIYEIKEHRNVDGPLIKIYYFCIFITDHNSFQEASASFLENHKVVKWKDYIKLMFDIIIVSNGTNIIDFKGYDVYKNICASLSIDNFSKNEYLSLREKPLYDLGDNLYVVCNKNFLIDKIYKSIKYQLSSLQPKNIKNNLLSDYSYNFTEKNLFHPIIESCFANIKTTSMSGDDLSKKVKGNKQPDYYIRCNEKVFLFEFKDVTISEELKNSNNYTEIEEGLTKKLITEQGGIQLKSLIDTLFNNPISIEDNIPDNKIIYPIIVFTDFSLNSYGINYLLNNKFKATINDIKHSNNIEVKDLILIDFDFFVEFQDLISEGHITFSQILDDYITKELNNTQDSYLSFKNYIRKHKIGYNKSTTKIFDDAMSFIGYPPSTPPKP